MVTSLAIEDADAKHLYEKLYCVRSDNLGSSNDYADDLLFDAGYRHQHLVDGSPHWGFLLRPLQWIGNDTEIGKRVKLIWGASKRKSAISVEAETVPASSQVHPIAAMQQDGLRRLVSLAREMGAKPVVSWANPPQAGESSYTWLRQWCESNNLAFADWYPIVQSTIDANPGLSARNPHSGGHYRSWVNQQIALSFSTYIE